MIRRIVVAAATLGLLAGCGTDQSHPGGGFPGAVGAPVASDCPVPSGAGVNVDPPVISNTLNDIEYWLEVDAPIQFTEPEEEAYTTRVDVVAEVSNIKVESSSPEKVELAVPGDYLQPINEYVKRGDPVFLGVESFESKEYVHVLVSRTEDGSFFFGGACGTYSLNDPLYTSVGDQFDATVEKMIGMPGPEIMEMLSPPMPEPSTVKVLGENVPTQGLDEVQLVLNYPMSFAGNDFAICSRLDAGLNECVSLAGKSDTPPNIRAWTSAKQPLEFVLTSSNGVQDLQSIGTVQVSEEVLTASRTRGGLWLFVTLSGAWDKESERIQDPAASVVATYTGDTLAEHPGLKLSVFDGKSSDGFG